MGIKLNGGKPKFALDFEERAAIPIGESPRGILEFYCLMKQSQTSRKRVLFIY